MASLNKVLILGNLGKDPEIRQTQGGKSVANLTIATSEKWTDDKGERKEHTEWHRVIAWNKLADICGKYLKKGRSILVEGKLQTRKHLKDGVAHYNTEIIAESIQFIGTGERPKDGTSVEVMADAHEMDKFQDIPF